MAKDLLLEIGVERPSAYMLSGPRFTGCSQVAIKRSPPYLAPDQSICHTAPVSTVCGAVSRTARGHTDREPWPQKADSF